jgi:hypothetical protein
VKAANDMAALDPTLGELCGAAAAAIVQRRRRALRVEEQHDVLAQEAKRLRTVGEFVHGHGGVPEIAEHLLSRVQRGWGPRTDRRFPEQDGSASASSQRDSCQRGIAAVRTGVRAPIFISCRTGAISY